MMQNWFTRAKLGIFLHWGLYSVDGVEESWSFFKGDVSHDAYFRQTDGFTATRYDPDVWLELFAKIGAKYAVLTTKHHDGFALWDTVANDFSAVKASPAKRDLVRPFCEAARHHGLKLGLYYSHLDWAHPDYASVYHGSHRANAARPADLNRYTFDRLTPDPIAWERFLHFHHTQLQELCLNFRPDLLWFDGDWERDAEQWKAKALRDQLHAWLPNVVINSRLSGYGDYATPEQAIPVIAPDRPWELCQTVNDSWGWRPSDQAWKTPRQIVRMFAECIGMGGNFLLNVAPCADGTLAEPYLERLDALGVWINKHAEAIYDTVAGLPLGHAYGPTLLTPDRTTLYAVVFDRPVEGFQVKGVRNTVRAVTVVGGDGTLLAHRKVGGFAPGNMPGDLWIDVPARLLDPTATVLKIELSGPLDLYHGAGRD